ncbi:hypothetical protein [Phaeobacter sp. C3_T13_0]|uniref:hypothetical protein n=1 Tax=Phaeobacter cretensis TaxID=3342641 RepID=UPI0039BD237C
MTCTSDYLFDLDGLFVVSRGVFRTPFRNMSPSHISAGQAATAGAFGLGPNSRVPLVYLHRDYHADERSPKLLDILNDWQHAGPVHALRISSVATAKSARGFVQALLQLSSSIVVLEDAAQTSSSWDSRFYVLTADPCTDTPLTEQNADAAALSARLSDLGDHSPSARS